MSAPPTCRNLQKKAKKARYEREKAYMDSIRGLGNVTGDYVGDGQGDSVSTEPDGAIEPGGAATEILSPVSEDVENSECNEVSSDAEPLLFLYDCETIGLSIYNDHITDIAAKVIASPVPLSDGSFSSLVKTSKHISAPGMSNLLSMNQFKLYFVCHSF